MEKETAEFITYLNDEVVPAVPSTLHQGVAGRSEKMSKLATIWTRSSPTAGEAALSAWLAGVALLAVMLSGCGGKNRRGQHTTPPHAAPPTSSVPAANSSAPSRRGNPPIQYDKKQEKADERANALSIPEGTNLFLSNRQRQLVWAPYHHRAVRMASL